MTEEQEKAIRRLRIRKDFTGMDNGVCVVNVNDVEIVLALIEQQDFKISSLKQVHDYDVQVIDDVKGEAVKLYNRIEEKDKIIDLMAEYIEGKKFFVDRCFNVLPAKIIKQYFEKQAKNI